MDIHAEHDPVAGEPFCADCYDYDADVIWQWWAPELRRRFTIALPRLIANCPVSNRSRQGGLVRVSFAKVAEYQVRGVVHFHAIIRMTGPPIDENLYPAPLVEVDSTWLGDCMSNVYGRE